MKNLKNLLILFFVAAMAFSCSEDEPEPQLESIEFGTFSDSETLAVPSLTTVEDQHAQEVGSLINQMNPAIYSGFYTVPEGAEERAEPITATNGRINATTLTYEWTVTTDSAQVSIAYQITEETDRYFVEIFIKANSEPYVKWFEGSKTKDGKSGNFIVLDPNADVRSEFIRYDYEFLANGSLFVKYSFPSFNRYHEATINTDRSGTLTSFEGQTVKAEYTWDGAGNGTWALYGDAGNKVSGTWTIEG